MYGFYGVHKHSVFSGYDFIDKLGRGLIDVLNRFWKCLYPLSKHGSCWEIFELDCEDVARVVRWIALGSGVCVSLYWWRFMYHNVLPFITYPPLLLFTDFHLPPFYNWFLTIWDKKKYNYWMKSEIALLWIIFDLISSKLLMDLTLIIRKLSFTRISGPHEPIIDLSENRLVQSPCWSSQSTLQLWPSCYLKGYLFILFDYLTSTSNKFFYWPSVPNRKTTWCQKRLLINEIFSGRLQEVFLFGIWKNKH